MLVLFATPGLAKGVFQATKPLTDAGYDVRYVAIPGLSRVFVAEAHRLRQPDGRLLPALMRKYAPGEDPGQPIIFAGFSAGVWLWRDGISVHRDDRAQTAAVIAIDGLHATDEQLRTTRRYLGEGGSMLVIHSDTPTHGYPSTTDTAQRLLSVAGDLTVRHSPGGHAWSTLRAAEHISEWLSTAELDTTPPPAPAPPTRTWPGDRGDEVRRWQEHIGVAVDGVHGPVTERASQLWLSSQYEPLGSEFRLGLRCLHWCGYQLGVDPREVIGPVHHPLILSYSTHCRRGGTLYGVHPDGRPIWGGGVSLRAPSDEWAWCAMAQSEALRVNLAPGEEPPHGLRVAVRELVEDARKVGTLHLASSDYEPQPGDLAISSRIPRESPLRGGRGHVERLVGRQEDGRLWLIGGNEDGGATHGGRWRLELEEPDKVEAWIEV